MRCVPIFTRVLNDTEDSQLVQAWLLLEKGGTAFMSVDDLSGATAFAEENGLALKETHTADDTIYLIVDHVKTNLNEFYSWGETASEMWRPFVWYIPKKPENDQYINLCHMESSFGPVLSTYFLRQLA